VWVDACVGMCAHEHALCVGVLACGSQCAFVHACEHVRVCMPVADACAARYVRLYVAGHATRLHVGACADTFVHAATRRMAVLYPPSRGPDGVVRVGGFVLYSAWALLGTPVASLSVPGSLMLDARVCFSNAVP
jgi:hypothetical protein